MAGKKLETTSANLNVRVPYHTLRIKYGACTHRDNRPTFIRIGIDCLRDGVVTHTVCHVVSCWCNCRVASAILRDTVKIWRLMDRLSRTPQREIVFEVSSLSAYLMLTSQRNVLTTADADALRSFKTAVRKSPVNVTVTLASPDYSRELTEYIDDMIFNSTFVLPTYSRLGYADRDYKQDIMVQRALWR